jgi:branched-chain amino acid transport system permease protein
MLYRATGQFRTSYAQDARIFPLPLDRAVVLALVAFAFLVVPNIADHYWLMAILVPWLILSLAALGQNIITGYAGQLSIGSAGFMAVGAFSCYNFMLRIDGMPFLVAVVLAGLTAALVGVVFGLPSLRIRGLYLAVATLAAQFFIVWTLEKFGWFTNYDPAGVMTAQPIVILGYRFDTPAEKYVLTLAIVCVLALAAKNMARSNTGRSWMAVRDMDVAAEVVGFRLMQTKLLAFAISSFYCGVAGALMAFVYFGAVEPSAFSILLSFQILFMVIIGGLASILGSFIGAAVILLLPIFMNIFFHAVVGAALDQALLSAFEVFLFGALIVFFLIVEPHGLARLWQVIKERLRLWPFPH